MYIGIIAGVIGLIFCIIFLVSIISLLRKQKDVADLFNKEAKSYSECKKVLQTVNKIAADRGLEKKSYMEIYQILKSENKLPIKIEFNKEELSKVNKTNEFYVDKIKEPEEKSIRLKTLALCDNYNINKLSLTHCLPLKKIVPQSNQTQIERILCMYCNYMFAYELTSGQNSDKIKEKVSSFMLKYELGKCLTSREKEIYRNPRKDELIDTCNKIECVETLLWALGFIKKIDGPNKPAKDYLKILPTFFNSNISTQEFASKAEPKSIMELYQMLDFYYVCYQSSLMQLKEGKIKKLNLIALERYRALKWLLNNQNRDIKGQEFLDLWDKVDV